MAEGKLQVNKFTGGLVTDHHALDSVPNTTVDEDNVDLDRRGYRKRRKGLEIVGGDVVGATPTWTTDYIKTYSWNSVNNDGNLNFLIVQLGSSVSFINKAILGTDGLLPFAVDLSMHKAPGVSNADVSKFGIQVASGHGLLFIVGEKIVPLEIQYFPDTNTITTTEINIQIRDMQEQDSTSANDLRPSTLTPQRRYDLINQGWGAIPPYTYNQRPNLVGSVSNTQTALEFYKSGTNFYPPKTKPWWVGKRFGDGDHEYFVPDDTYDMVEGGNTLAALGHYVVTAFDIDRSAISGVAGLVRQVILSRPTAVAFYSGRVFYALGNTIYFSQIIQDDLSVVGKCYQEADPTSENVNDLIATDGGVMTIADSGTAIALFVIENSLLLFSNNGVWAIGGGTPGSGFSATGFSVQRISGVGALGPRSIIDVQGVPAWWTDRGIMMLDASQIKVGNYKIESLTDEKLRFYYTTLSTLTKTNATGAFDHIANRLIWLYNDDPDQNSETDRFTYNRVLNFDMQYGAWFPYTVADRSVDGKFLWDVFNIQTFNLTVEAVNVTENDGTTLVDNSGGDQVIVNNEFFSTTAGLASDVLYLVSGIVVI